jgi:uncharacterized protein (TIGR00290 family)
MREPVLLAWSGGKDSALALRETLSSGACEITLLTTVTEGYQRVSMHGVRESLLRVQAERLGLPIDIVSIPRKCSDEEYRSRMELAMLRHRERGCRTVVFGDIFLQDVREYREKNLDRVAMKAVFPLWERDSRALSREFIDSGFGAVVTCVDTKALPATLAGRLYDRSFLRDLPPEADPCGENGEFHSFVFRGPLFSGPVSFQKGEVVLRDERFCFCDLLPEDAGRA